MKCSKIDLHLLENVYNDYAGGYYPMFKYRSRVGAIASIVCANLRRYYYMLSNCDIHYIDAGFTDGLAKSICGYYESL